MAPTLASALTLSTLGHVSKAFLNFACKDVRVQGLDHLLNALQEPEAVKTATSVNNAGKVDGAGVASSRRSRRRGIITSTFLDKPAISSCNNLYRSMQSHLGGR